MDRLPPASTPTGDRTGNLGMCPDLESSLQPSGAREDAQPTEPHWPGREQLLGGDGICLDGVEDSLE